MSEHNVVILFAVTMTEGDKEPHLVEPQYDVHTQTNTSKYNYLPFKSSTRMHVHEDTLLGVSIQTMYVILAYVTCDVIYVPNGNLFLAAVCPSVHMGEAVKRT